MSAVQLGYAYRDVDDDGQPLRRDYTEVAELIGLPQERYVSGWRGSRRCLLGLVTFRGQESPGSSLTHRSCGFGMMR